MHRIYVRIPGSHLEDHLIRKHTTLICALIMFWQYKGNKKTLSISCGNQAFMHQSSITCEMDKMDGKDFLFNLCDILIIIFESSERN